MKKYSKYSIDLLERRICAAYQSRELSGFELRFLDDILKIVFIKGVDLKLTNKQTNTLHKIFDESGAYIKTKFREKATDDYLCVW